jgi:hypothetical protein
MLKSFVIFCKHVLLLEINWPTLGHIYIAIGSKLCLENYFPSVCVHGTGHGTAFKMKTNKQPHLLYRFCVGGSKAPDSRYTILKLPKLNVVLWQYLKVLSVWSTTLRDTVSVDFAITYQVFAWIEFLSIEILHRKKICLQNFGRH